MAFAGFESFAFAFNCCHSCGADTGLSLSVCTKCLSVAYCDSKCQRHMWPTHKLTCRANGDATLSSLRIRADAGDTKAIADLKVVLSRGLCNTLTPQAAPTPVPTPTPPAANAKASKKLSTPPPPPPPAKASKKLSAAALLKSQSEKHLNQVQLSAGEAAANSGDFATALSIYEKLGVGTAPTVISSSALYYLSKMYHLGQGVPVDYLRSHAYTRAAVDAAAAAGARGESGAAFIEARALSQLSYDDYFGLNGSIDPATFYKRAAVNLRVFKYIERAWALAPIEVSPALVAVVAIGYLKGCGVELNIDRSVLWVSRAWSPPPYRTSERRSSDARQSSAINELWSMCQPSAAAPPRFEAAVIALCARIADKWADSNLKAARDATWILARHLLRSRFEKTPSGWAPINHALERAAKEGCGCAAADLHVAYRDGINGVTCSKLKAAKWAERCAELGHSVPTLGEGTHCDH